MKALVIYHAPCADGFTAAWIAESVLSQDMDVELYPADYRESAPIDLITKDTKVYILDFSYPWEQMLAICDAASRHVVLLDHHKTALENLANFEHPNLIKVLDRDYSGAGLSWRWFFPNKAMPPLVQRVQDRDLWRFQFADSKEVSEAIFSRPYTLEAWDEMAAMDIEDLAYEGASIKRKKDKDIDEFIAAHARPIYIGDYEILACNLPYFYASECGQRLLDLFQANSFAATYFDTVDGYRQFSLRSANDRLDVSLIAKKFGGGGHRNAAGFRVLLSDLDSWGNVPFPIDPMFTFEEDEE